MRMGGQPFQGRTFAHTLRKRLWSIHLGVPLDCDVLNDPIHDDCYIRLWRERCITNTLTYFSLFEGMGDNSISQMISVRKILLEKQAKSEGKKTVENEKKRSQSLGALNVLRLHSFGFHHPLFSPPSDPWKIPIYCNCCDTVNMMSDSQTCPDCSKTFCCACISKAKCHICHGNGKCPPNRTGEKKNLKEYLDRSIRGFCCCYPADYLKDCDLNDQLLSKVVGRMVFQ
jgi:hypothetical protein